MVLDRSRDEHDPLAQQPRINVEAALAPVGLFDDDGDELGGDILVVDHGRWVPWNGWVAATSARNGEGSRRQSPSTSYAGPPPPQMQGRMESRRTARPSRTAPPRVACVRLGLNS